MILWWVWLSFSNSLNLIQRLIKKLSSTLYKLVASSHEDMWMLIVDVIFVDWYFYGMQGCKCHSMFRTDFSEENIGTNIVPKWALAGGTHLFRISSIFWGGYFNNYILIKKTGKPFSSNRPVRLCLNLGPARIR